MYTKVLVTLTGYSKSISVMAHNRLYHISHITVILRVIRYMSLALFFKILIEILKFNFTL